MLFHKLWFFSKYELCTLYFDDVGMELEISRVTKQTMVGLGDGIMEAGIEIVSTINGILETRIAIGIVF